MNATKILIQDTGSQTVSTWCLSNSSTLYIQARRIRILQRLMRGKSFLKVPGHSLTVIQLVKKFAAPMITARSLCIQKGTTVDCLQRTKSTLLKDKVTIFCWTPSFLAGSIPAGVSGFFIDIKSFRSHYGPGVDSASTRNEYQEYFLGVKAAGG